MKITGLISAQRPGPPRGWTHAAMRVVQVTMQTTLPPASTLPPQAKGDAAHLTLMMAQVYGATLKPQTQPGASYPHQPAMTGLIAGVVV